MAIPELSAVEQQVVLLVAQGRSRRAIADELGLSLKTVEWHLARGRRKLERAATLHDRMQQAEELADAAEFERVGLQTDQIVEALGPQPSAAVDNQRRKS